MSRIEEINFQIEVLQRELKTLTAKPKNEPLALVEGDWYGWSRYTLFRFQYLGKTGNYSAKGFGTLGDWSNDLGVHKDELSEYFPLTLESVSSSLIDEAIKRGFRYEGIMFKLIQGSYTGQFIDRKITLGATIEYEEIEKRLILKEQDGAIYTIFKNGVWAKIEK
jgi:hypothetical protein